MRLQNVFVPNVLEIFIYETRGESPGGFPGDFGYDIIAGPHSMIEEKHPTIVWGIWTTCNTMRSFSYV